MPPDATQKPNLRSNKTLKKGSRGQMGEPGSWKPSIRAKARPPPSRLSPLEPSDSGLSPFGPGQGTGLSPLLTMCPWLGRAGQVWGASLQGKT